MCENNPRWTVSCRPPVLITFIAWLYSITISRTLHLRKIEAKWILFIPQIRKNEAERTLFIPQIGQIEAKRSLFIPQIRKNEGKRSLFIPQTQKIEAEQIWLIPEIGKIEAKKKNWIKVKRTEPVFWKLLWSPGIYSKELIPPAYALAGLVIDSWAP